MSTPPRRVTPGSTEAYIRTPSGRFPGMKFRSFAAAEISEVYAAYQDVRAKWRDLPIGGQLEMRW
jgi:hypothetical protein